MPTIKTDILIYLPYDQSQLSERSIQWLNSFRHIIEICFKQIVKKDFRVLQFFANNLQTLQKDEFDGNIVLQLFLSNEFNKNDLLSDHGVNIQPDEKLMFNLICFPEFTIDDYQANSSDNQINFFDEALKKSFDLNSNINALKNEVWLKFLDISLKIRKYLEKGDKKKSIKNGIIYLAETSHDQDYNRDILKRELEHQAYTLLPDGKLSDDLIQSSEQVHESLAKSFLSIHIIGNNYAPLIKNVEISSVELQNDLFNEVLAENANDIHRLVWIPVDIKPKSEKQKQYIENFKRNIELLKNTEIIQTPIEIFKNIVKKKAVELSKTKYKDKENQKVDSQKKVYIINNGTDGNTLEVIRKKLKDNRIDVLETSTHEDKIEHIKTHYANLVQCDAILIAYSSKNVQWLNSKLSDVLKAPGFGKRNRFLVKNIFNFTIEKPLIYLKVLDLEVHNLQKDETEKKVKSFIEKINKNV